MPDQDSQQSNPDSETTIKTDSSLTGPRRNNNSPTGTAHRPSSQQGSERSRLELAVDNGAVRRSLREIVGAHNRAGQTSSASATDASSTGIGRIFEAQEETARRIAQSLHDEASQMLAIVYLELAHIARTSPAPTSERIDRVIKHLDSVSEQIRGLSHELRPMVLERHGLLPALYQLAGGVKKRSGLNVRVIGEVSGLSLAIDVCIYRVVQEALANVVRHAGASNVEIKLWKAQDKVHCTVRDDGVGYRPTGQSSEERYELGLGLVGIYERIESLGGDCHILSDGRKGMELQLGIPL